MRQTSQARFRGAVPPRLSQVIVGWLRTVSPEELQEMAEEGRSIIERLRAQYGNVRPGFLRLLLSPGERESLARLEPEDLDLYLDLLLLEAPEQAEVLWAHQTYYVRQMLDLRDAVLRKR